MSFLETTPFTEEHARFNQRVVKASLRLAATALNQVETQFGPFPNANVKKMLRDYFYSWTALSDVTATQGRQYMQGMNGAYQVEADLIRIPDEGADPVDPQLMDLLYPSRTVALRLQNTASDLLGEGWTLATTPEAPPLMIRDEVFDHPDVAQNMSENNLGVLAYIHNLGRQGIVGAEDLYQPTDGDLSVIGDMIDTDASHVNTWAVLDACWAGSFTDDPAGSAWFERALGRT
jgi:hypothetical protein